VDGQTVEVESVDWVAEASHPQAPPDPAYVDRPTERPGPDEIEPPRRGRLIVLMFQTDMHYSRITGLMRVDGHAVDFVRSLAPEDRVAMAVMGSHLQLHSDFTDEFEGLSEWLTAPQVLKWRHAEDDGRSPSLARHFDEHRARRATNLSQALEVIGDALEPIAGTKAVVLFGWGAGKFQGRTGVVRLGPDYVRAVRALAGAHASVFSLDITSADRHSLEVGLQWLAEDTGGFYIRTHLFPELAVDKLTRALTGHYIVTLMPPEEELEERFKVKVKVDIPGTEVLARRVQFSDS
jgi:hypothetical protein